VAKSRALGDAELAVGEADPAFPLLVMTVDTGC
jgi:hypothetical protein